MDSLRCATHSRDLTDEQWDLISGFLPEPVRRANGRARPWRENRAVLNGICGLGLAPHGRTCQTATVASDLPPAVSTMGPSRRVEDIRVSSLRRSTTRAIWMWRKRSSMGVSRHRETLVNGVDAFIGESEDDDAGLVEYAEGQIHQSPDRT